MPGLIRFLVIATAVYFGVRWLRKRFGGVNFERAIPTAQSGVVRKVNHHDNGRMASERYLMDGVMHGPYMLWDRAGNKTAQGEYRNGMLHGAERRFGGDGRVIGEVIWEEGRRLETRKEGADGELIELRLVDQAATKVHEQPEREQAKHDPTKHDPTKHDPINLDPINPDPINPDPTDPDPPKRDPTETP
jgi:hypothetical protein